MHLHSIPQRAPSLARVLGLAARAASLALALVALAPLLLADGAAPAAVAQPIEGASLPARHSGRTASGVSSAAARRHVFLIVLENEEQSQVIGSPDAPYLSGLARQFGTADQYYGVRHPSLPNYLSLLGGDTFGVTTDCGDCFVDAPNLADQLDDAGLSWAGYFEDLPAPCYLGDDTGGYAARHNPFSYFRDIRGDRARCGLFMPFAWLPDDLANNRLPDFTWIGPNLCHSGHDCPLKAADAWLSGVVPLILASPAWQQGGLLVITFDEGTSDAACCGDAAGGRVPLIVAWPGGPAGYASQTPYSHYSLLRSLEDVWGLPYLGHAGDPDTQPLTDLFPPPQPPQQDARH